MVPALADGGEKYLSTSGDTDLRGLGIRGVERHAAAEGPLAPEDAWIGMFGVTSSDAFGVVRLIG